MIITSFEGPQGRGMTLIDTCEEGGSKDRVPEWRKKFLEELEKQSQELGK